MRNILKSLRKKFPDANFKYIGYSSNKKVKLIGCDKFIMLEKTFLVRCSMLTKRYNSIKFLVVYDSV